VDAAGTGWLVTDNDGTADSSGETYLLVDRPDELKTANLHYRRTDKTAPSAPRFRRESGARLKFGREDSEKACGFRLDGWPRAWRKVVLSCP
jgi:hypothetical protein